jgi:two-component system, chemotaxis family, response regulator Rcp1
MQHSGRTVEVLLVDHNPAEARLTEQAFAQGAMVSHVTVTPGGVETIQFLRREPPQFTGAPRPDLILLDLSAPRGNGRELLEEIKGDPDLRRIPVMVLSSSEAADDLRRVYNQHANCYIRKPAGLAEFVEVIRSIEQFWFEIVTLPAK